MQLSFWKTMVYIVAILGNFCSAWMLYTFGLHPFTVFGVIWIAGWSLYFLWLMRNEDRDKAWREENILLLEHDLSQNWEENQ